MFSQKCHIFRLNIWFLKFCIFEKDILESSVSSPYVEVVSNSAGDSPHLDAPLWISSEFLQPLSNSQIPSNVFQYDPNQWTSEPFILET